MRGGEGGGTRIEGDQQGQELSDDAQIAPAGSYDPAGSGGFAAIGVR